MPMLPFACIRPPPALLPASACTRAAPQIPAGVSRKPQRAATAPAAAATSRRRASRALSLGYTVPPLTELGMLGQGACGSVRAAHPREGGPPVAVKCLPKDSAAARGAAVREARVMKGLDHDSICRLREVCEDESGVYLVLEHIEGRELFDHIGVVGLSDGQDVRDIMRQLLEALAHCDECGVVHLDVKPENVMIAEPGPEGDAPVVKLIDFGTAVRAGSLAPSAASAGPYSAPEVRRGLPARPSADVWSAGAVMHLLLTGSLPPQAVSHGLEPLDVLGSSLAALPAAAGDLLRDLLAPDERSRPSAARAAAHPWLCGAGAWADGGGSSPASACSDESLDSLLFQGDFGGDCSASTCDSLPPMVAMESSCSCLYDTEAA